ncbi:unnamed protein product [Pleuronectes platessa]|uniref:Uncharacterized protein n=1 Tax=Pleuronectes platessa TaxID=8262 RepID=A0A9N7VLV5_PLEPL|nr:unnamed protein product [Pleuronectes platessa]
MLPIPGSSSQSFPLLHLPAKLSLIRCAGVSVREGGSEGEVLRLRSGMLSMPRGGLCIALLASKGFVCSMLNSRDERFCLRRLGSCVPRCLVPR